MQHPDNLYVLVLAQTEVAIEVWSKRTGWAMSELRSLDDVLDLPEFGFTTTLHAIYAKTGVAPR